MVIDEESLDLTAQALETINPGRSSASHIRDMIRANLRPGDNSYIATSGWFNSTTNQTHVKPYTVFRYLELIK